MGESHYLGLKVEGLLISMSYDKLLRAIAIQISLIIDYVFSKLVLYVKIITNSVI